MAPTDNRKQLKDLPLFGQVGQPDTMQTSSGSEPPKHWTVSELTSRIRGVLEPAFKQVWVQGELSNCRPAASGHVYFSLKDENASISVAIFGWGKSGAGKRGFELKDGLQVLCRGKLSIYPPRGGYQLIAEQVEPLGAGALQIAFEQLKEKLAAEGLFDPRRKRPLPTYPRSIAVITSPSGAAIQDMLNILRRRAPHIRVVVIPALVQGDDAPRHLIRGVEAANRLSLGEIIVLARGGGSMEDLWCFNDEPLARAIAASRLPVISAVGHEIDFTISDFVADLRAPTPSAAAEIISGAWVDVAARIHEANARLVSAIRRDIAHRLQVLQHVAARVVGPRDRLREQAQRCDELAMRLERAIRARLERRSAGLEHLAGKLDALSPLRVLERGYALVREDGDGAVVRSASQIKTGQKLQVTFHDGNRTVQAV
ncbi:MAG: exodeoxyribonuclease VII large subunit [Oligoflexia bacterium]|nr:exodeoxyribonuclease VII large subunit [Oligoflexia bacterium]